MCDAVMRNRRHIRRGYVGPLTAGTVVFEKIVDFLIAKEGGRDCSYTFLVPAKTTSR